LRGSIYFFKKGKNYKSGESCILRGGDERLAKRKKGALKKTGVEGSLLQGVEGSLDLIRLSPVLSGVFF
jgi:hypothetical protein